MKEIPLTQGLVALVDDDDFEWLSQWKWCLLPDRKTHYAGRNRRLSDGHGGVLRMHRVILDAPAGFVVDHIDHNGLNNQRNNLRLCTHRENIANNQRARGASGFRGVKLDKHRKGKPFMARIRTDGRLFHLGCFEKPEDAARAYDDAALARWGEFATLNFPKEDGPSR